MNWKHTFVLAALLLLTGSPAIAQTEVGGVITPYSPLSGQPLYTYDYLEQTLEAFDRLVVAENLSAETVAKRIEVLSVQFDTNLLSAVRRNKAGRALQSSTSKNLRTNAGDDWQAEIMGDTGAPTDDAQCNYIALSNDSTGADATDTTLPSEIVANGLSRAQAVFAHSAGTSVYTLTKAFTASGAQSAQLSGVLSAASDGTLCFEAAITPVSVVNTDTLTITWTINF